MKDISSILIEKLPNEKFRFSINKSLSEMFMDLSLEDLAKLRDYIDSKLPKSEENK